MRNSRDDPVELAAEAFRLLREGVDVRDVVIALRWPPKEIEALYADWERLGDMLVPRARVQLERMVRYRLLMAEIWERGPPDALRAQRPRMGDSAGCSSRRR